MIDKTPLPVINLIGRFGRKEITLSELRNGLSPWVWKAKVEDEPEKLWTMQLLFAEYDQGHWTEEEICKAAQKIVNATDTPTESE